MSPQPLSRADAALTLAILQNHIRWIEGEWCAGAIDGIYATRARGSPTVLSGLMYGLSPGQWKQRELFDVNVSAAGTVSGRLESGEKFVRMPGIPKNSPLRSADNVIR